MKSHDLAKILLANPNLPIATFANNHTQFSGPMGHSLFGKYYESLKIATCEDGYSDKHIIIGNFDRLDFPSLGVKKEIV